LNGGNCNYWGKKKIKLEHQISEEGKRLAISLRSLEKMREQVLGTKSISRNRKNKKMIGTRQNEQSKANLCNLTAFSNDCLIECRFQ